MLGTKPPAGLVLPSYFVTVLDAANGQLTVLTTPGSACTLATRAPDGASLALARSVADASGKAVFDSPHLSDHGDLLQTATCTLAGQTGSASARIAVP